MNNALICLIGSNPLPNYLVCQYLNSDNRDEEEKKFIPKPDKYIFLCSNETTIFAEKLQEKCQLFDKLSIVKLDNERNPMDIKDKLSKKLNEIARDADSIHLNYTGGTKPMAVHSYQCVKEFCGAKAIRFIASDVSDEKSKIIIESDRTDVIYYPQDSIDSKKNLYNFVEIDCKTLFELHDMELDPERMRRTTSKLLDVNHDKIFEALTKEKEGEEIRNKINEIKERIKNKNLEKINQDFEIVKKYNIDYEFGLNIDKNATFESYSKNKFRAIIDYLHGKWLEDYLFKAIYKIKDELRLSELRLSVKPKYKGRECDIDVIAIKGYKLYLFSCTTSNDIKICKSKAFEAIYRADQLGGSHAKAICVNFMPEKPNGKKSKEEKNNNEELLKDMSSFGAKMNFDYISLDILKDEKQLEEKLKAIFKD
ncbi:MAG: DUF1887 family protein [Clostridiales bacterium]|nr:DUF1887 family protein [Clostridiales bacterium]